MKPKSATDMTNSHVAHGGNSQRLADFERLYTENFSKVFNYVSYRVVDNDAAQDITSDAFLKAARAFDRFDSRKASFSTWSIAIARNCIADYFRKNRPSTTLEDAPDELLAHEDEYPEVDDRAETVRRLLAVLDDGARELIYMKYYEGKRNVDIAEETGLNPSTVATRLARAIEKMRAALEKEEKGA